MEEKIKGNRRRRERAKKMRDELANVKASEDSCEEMPIVRIKPPRPKKRTKEPLFEEDLIDGFAVMAFRSFEDLERCVRAAEKTSSRILDAYPDKIKSEGARNRSSLSKVNCKVSGTGSRYSTEEEGYICDRESEGDKFSDVDDPMFYSPCIGGLAEKNHVSAINQTNILQNKQHLVIPSTNSTSTATTTSIQVDVSVSNRTESYYTSPITQTMTSSISAVSVNDGQTKTTIKEEPIFNCQTSNAYDQKTYPVDKKPNISSCMVNDEKKVTYPDQKYSIDQKPIIDTKPPTFSSMPQSTFNNSLFQPHFNTITTTAATIPISTVTTTVTSVPQSPINHISHGPSLSQPTVSNKSKFSVSSLVSGSNLDFMRNNSPAAEPAIQSSVIRPQSTKSYPVKSLVPSPVNKPQSWTPQYSSKSPQHPIYSSKSPQLANKSNLNYGTGSGSFPGVTPAYGSPHPLGASPSQYPVFHPSKPSTVPSYSSHIKMEPGEFGGKPSKIVHKVPHTSSPIFAPTGVNPNFGAIPVKSHPLIGGMVKREQGNGTPPRTTTPRYSPRMQDPHASLFNSPSSLGSRLSGFPRTSGPPGSFPLSRPISSPLPPSGIFSHPTGPPLGAPILGSTNSAEQDPMSAQADLLRRELDSRFLATQDRTAVGMATSGLGSIGPVPTLLRTDVHHHQHQHTHVHQHLLPHLPPPPLVPSAPSGIFSHSSATPSLFKEVGKVGIDNGLYHQRSGLGSFSSGLSPFMPANNSSPIVPPQITSVSKKTGRWNVMHVRIAWEIFYDQQKQANAKGVKLRSSDIMRSGPGIPGTPSLYSSLSRPNDHLGSMLAPNGSSHRIEGSSFLNAPPHITPSVPGFRYSTTAAPPHSSPFSNSNITPTNIPGPPPGAMFSREATPSGLSLAAGVHDPWRIRAPIPFGNSNPPSWHHKSDPNYYENERREQEEREIRERQEKERKEREERQRREEQDKREREQKEKREQEERERREREEKQREREKRAEHEKERLARMDAYNERGIHRRDESRSPLRLEAKDSRLPCAIGHQRLSSGSKYDSTKDEITIVGSKEGNRQQHATTSHLGPPILPPAPPSQYLSTHSLSTAASLERARMLATGYPSSGQPPIGHWIDPLRDPYRTAVVSSQDPFAIARAHDLAARESLMISREPLRESLDRAREEHLMRVNPLGTMILNERYREHQVAREMIERERNYVAAAAAAAGSVGGLYSHGALLPPHPGVSAANSFLQPNMKTNSPLGHSHIPHPSLHPQSLGSLYPTAHLGHPSLAPGLPPPLIPPLMASGQVLSRPPDKKDMPK